MIKAFVLLNTDTGVESLLKEEIKSLDGVKEAHQLFGEYDILAIVEGENEKEVQKTLSWELRKIKGIRGTNTLIVAK